MSGVFGSSYSHLYDDLNTGKDYAKESEFVVDVSVGSSRAKVSSLLDLGCGTGRHLEQLKVLFDEVVGVDRSGDMLEIAKSRLPGVRLVNEDASEVRLGRTFDVVTALFDVLSYQTSNTDVIRFFTTIREHLAPNGVAVVDFWHLAGLIADPPTTRVKRGVMGRSEYLRVSVPEVDWTTATTAVSITTLIWENNRVEALTEEHDMRAFLVPELASLATLAGLLVNSSGGWLRSGPEGLSDWHAYVTLIRVA